MDALAEAGLAEARKPPEAPAWADLYLTAFRRLSSDRPWLSRIVSMPMGGTIADVRAMPIPWTAADRYADRLGLLPGEREFFHRMICDLDDEYLDFVNQRRS